MQPIDQPQARRVPLALAATFCAICSAPPRKRIRLWQPECCSLVASVALPQHSSRGTGESAPDAATVASAEHVPVQAADATTEVVFVTSPRHWAKGWLMSNRPGGSAPGSTSQGRPKVAPSAQDLPYILEAIAEAERGEVMNAETSAAYIRWLKTGEGPCPWPDDS